ncbi:hypothetical protein NQ314_009960 [Rhamnusium bicolor]|uniref:Regulatory protein zeste n=1 Tax=Rhamnusium bicolor TaxID=1586634 RepID=A0AAV8XUJ7_9CUCU|nr:hypothetical protein NQ314_009960 [Rhamnusium bicolor]
MSTSAKSRCPRFENAEKEMVFELISKYKHIVENKKTDAVTNEEKRKTWTQIAAEFNSMCPAMHYRSAESISKLWKNSKKIARQQAGQERQERIKTGGGSADIIKKDENYDSIISILNEKTVFGLTNPFDADKNIKSETSENQAMSETNDDEEIIELVIEDSDLHENCNTENEEAVPTTSSTPTTAKRVYENVPEENTTWKKI